MSKTFETKGRILDLLKQGPKTPTDIGRYLNLSPSTVSQHLKELKDAGKLEEFQDEHFKNIKYYRRTQAPSIFNSNAAKFAIGAVALAVVTVLLFSFGSHVYGAASTGQSGNVGIFMTDPPQVPNGTTALVVSYSSLKVQVANSSGTFWESVNGTGTVNLLSLVNFSTNLASFKLPANSLVDKLSLNLSNASIIVNGTTYPVYLSSKNVTVKVVYSNQSSAAYDILFDMFPAVSAAISGNQTIFVMAPSATAATVSKSINPYYGQQQQLGAKAKNLVKLSNQEVYLLSRSRTNISITGATISTSGNQTDISLSVMDNSNYSTKLLAVSILGNASYTLSFNFSNQAPRMPDSTRRQARPSGTYSYSNWPSPNATNQYQQGNGPQGPFQPQPNLIRVGLNRSTISALVGNMSNKTFRSGINNIIRANGFGNISSNQTGNVVFGHIMGDVNAANYIQSKLDRFRSLDFLVLQNGTLALPQPAMLPGYGNGPMPQGAGIMLNGFNSGYNLSAGSTATLRYNGELSMGNGHLGIQLKPGQTYRIVIIGTGGAYATVNATVS